MPLALGCMPAVTVGFRSARFLLPDKLEGGGKWEAAYNKVFGSDTYKVSETRCGQGAGRQLAAFHTEGVRRQLLHP